MYHIVTCIKCDTYPTCLCLQAGILPVIHPVIMGIKSNCESHRWSLFLCFVVSLNHSKVSKPSVRASVVISLIQLELSTWFRLFYLRNSDIIITHKCCATVHEMEYWAGTRLPGTSGHQAWSCTQLTPGSYQCLSHLSLLYCNCTW